MVKLTNNDIQLKEINHLAKMIQVSLLAYFSGGAFLSLSYFDLPWHLVSLVVLLEKIVSEQTLGKKTVPNYLRR